MAAVCNSTTFSQRSSGTVRVVVEDFVVAGLADDRVDEATDGYLVRQRVHASKQAA